jgi:predicted flap endonuclease-1-like 5' DNA nuclease
MLFHSTLPADKAKALQALVIPVVEELGGEEAVSDYEVEVEETVTTEEAAAAEAADDAAVAVAAAPEAPAEAETPPAAIAVAPAAADDLTQLAGIGPKAAAALTAAGITTYAALAQSNEPQIRHALYQSGMLPPGSVSSWPMQAEYAAKGDWQGLMKRNQKTKAAKAPAAAAAAAPEPAAAPDDLTQINGIGPRLASILSRGGVTTYSQLEQMSPDELREIIALGGALPPASLGSWPAQASYAVRGDWSGLATYNRSR